MDVDAYLERIGYRGELAPTVEVLRRLHAAHLLAVPFENLSIHATEPIALDVDALFDKVVRRRRGGFCYELNGLFAALLGELGFRVTRLSAGVARAEGGFGPEFDHMALRVELDERWLADVGFGAAFVEPLRLDERGEQSERDRAYRIAPGAEPERMVLFRRERDGAWEPQYRFTLAPHAMADYAAMCCYHETSPSSLFTQRRVCSLATADGRVTLSELRLITTRADLREERELADEAEHARLLRDRFGIVMQRPWARPPR